MHHCLRRQAEALFWERCLGTIRWDGTEWKYGTAYIGRCGLVLSACLCVCWTVEYTLGMSWNGLSGRQCQKDEK